MLWPLRILFSLIIGSMLAITGWAGLQGSLWAIPHEVLTHPWFLATLADAYWAFITFYVWVAWKETAWGARILWFVAIVLLGNLAMAGYALIELGRVPASTPLCEVLTRRNPGHLAVPGIFAAVGIAIYCLA